MAVREILAAAVMVLTGGAAVAPGDAAAATAKIDRPMKLELLDALAAAPGLVWYGSSTSREMKPLTLRKHSGVQSFNLSFSAGRPYDFNYFSNHVATRWPEAAPKVVIGLDVEQLRRRQIEKIVPRAAGATPLASDRFTALGFRKRNPYANARLADRLAPSIERYRREVYPAFPALADSPKRDLRAVLRAANAEGITPVIVLMPVHPKFERQLRNAGRAARKIETKAWLRKLKGEGVKFQFVDASSPATFGGTAAGFYDAVHMQPGNADRLLTWLDAKGYI